MNQEKLKTALAAIVDLMQDELVSDDRLGSPASAG